MLNADAVKVAVCETLLEINREDERHPIIPPTAINWIGDKITTAVLNKPKRRKNDD